MRFILMVIVMVRQLWLKAYYWTFKFNNGENMQGREYILESCLLTSFAFVLNSDGFTIYMRPRSA